MKLLALALITTGIIMLFPSKKTPELRGTWSVSENVTPAKEYIGGSCGGGDCSNLGGQGGGDRYSGMVYKMPDGSLNMGGRRFVQNSDGIWEEETNY